MILPRVNVSRRTLQCRVRHFTPTYDMTKALQIYVVLLAIKFNECLLLIGRPSEREAKYANCH